MAKKTDNISVYPQDLPVDISRLIRDKDKKAMIYPASAILTNAKEYFTDKEINYIYKRQEELFSIPIKQPRSVVIRSKSINQEDIFRMIYHKQNKPNYNI